ncbi:dual oxidase maturation factor 1-like [Rhynchophorus ferrugineus]|uniref:dual oxidase maturation factor 1-like n=1 Tax=Rhynchophorus ferrugineus TaxID=354439 RepID=UPI003FCE524C
MLWKENVILILFSFIICALLISLLRPNWKEVLITYVRTFIKLVIGLMILLSIYSSKWEEGSLRTSTQFLPGHADQVNYTIKLLVGIHGFNISIQGHMTEKDVIKNKGYFVGKVIEYNERFEWSWSDANKMKEYYEESRARNLPKPLLWALEYFVVDEPGSRYGRFYRSASWYTNLFLWTAFISYLISLVMFQTVVNYGIYFLATSGMLLLIANSVWAIIKNSVPLEIYMGNGTLVPHYGLTFWCCFSTGLICLLLAGILTVITLLHENYICTIFAVDPGQWYDEVIYLLKKERLTYCDFPVINNEDVDDGDDDSLQYTAVYLRRGTVSYRKMRNI